MALPAAWYLLQFSADQTTNASIEALRKLAGQVRELRGYYTKNVVGAAKRNELKITRDYAQHIDVIPLLELPK